MAGYIGDGGESPKRTSDRKQAGGVVREETM